ncbi:alpha/beta hydrolase [Herbiconiux sp. 11R-BC]|uniref:alpha/beta hydrolase n=1 Tax=Herbiconiux sp. 11R-BC TaxID=3111637 RepID=UPI003BFDD36D
MTDFTSTARGDRVAFDRYGSGPALVFIAGAGPTRAGDPVTTETAQLAAADGLATLVFDRLGRGESPADGTLDLDRELEAVAAAVEAAAGPGGGAVLCGHSSGCAIALRAAVAGLPIDGLVLWEAPLEGDAADIAEWNAGFERLLDAGEFEQAQMQYMRDMPPEFLEGAKASPAWPHIVRAVPSLRADGEALAWATEALENHGLAGIRMPVLALYGTQTFPQMPLAAARIAAAVPGAEERPTSGAMHSWQADSMAAELVAFVKAAAARD